MADLSTQDLAELRQLYKDLQNISIPNMDTFIKALGGMDAARKNLQQMRQEFANINSDVNYLSASLTKVLIDLKGQNGALNITKKAYSGISSIASKLKYDQDGISRLNKKDLDSISKKAIQEKQRLKLAQDINIEGINSIANQLKSISYNPKKIKALQAEKKALEEANNEIEGFLTDTINGYTLLEGAINKRIKKEKLANEALGVSGALVNGIASTMDKLGLGGLVNLESIKEKMQEVADAAADKAQAEGKSVTFGDKLKVLGTGISESFKSMGESLKDPVVAFKILYDLASKADVQTTALAKSLMQTKTEAEATREQFVEMSRSIDDTYTSTDKLIEANAALGKQMGFNKVFSQDMNQTFVDLTKKIGLSEEAAGGLARVSIATGKTLKSTEQTIAGVTSKISAQNGIQLDGKEILEESGKVSGQLLANFKGNPAAIAEAVAQTKVLGTTLEQTKNQADKLLDFESSIGSQLKAELLTGQQLNLERARAAALQGDQATVAKELADQNVNFNKFSKMNVIQQRALSESLGLSADQLSDQLLKQEAIGKSRSEIVALGGEDAAKRLEALSAQDKFNAATEKLKDLIGNLVAGPLGSFLDMISEIASIVFKIIGPIAKIVSFALKPVTGLLNFVSGGITGAIGAADDMVGYGARTLSTPTGTVALNNNDTVIAGTNLFKGDDVMSFPKGKLNLGGGSNSRLEDLMTTLIDVTKSGNNKQIGIDLDGRAVGTGVVRATYQSA